MSYRTLRTLSRLFLAIWNVVFFSVANHFTLERIHWVESDHLSIIHWLLGWTCANASTISHFAIQIFSLCPHRRSWSYFSSHQLSNNMLTANTQTKKAKFNSSRCAKGVRGSRTLSSFPNLLNRCCTHNVSVVFKIRTFHYIAPTGQMTILSANKRRECTTIFSTIPQNFTHRLRETQNYRLSE